MNGQTKVKIFFEINNDVDKPKSESIWAEDNGLGNFRIDNIPFFTYGISYNDIIFAELDRDNLLFFKKVIKRGGHSTLRLFFTNKLSEQEKQSEIKKLNKIGAVVERATESLFAIDVSPDTNLKSVISLLKEGEQRGEYEYEEGYIYNSNEGK